MNRLVLIDGNAVLHRAYHALPPLTAPDGRVVNAVYGFTSMLLKIITDLRPTHLAVAFDRPKPTFRKELFEKYQATRPKMDEELVGQIGPVHEVIGAFGIPVFEMDGFEADDIIGTLCRQILNPKSLPSRQAGKILNKTKVDQVIIVTGDRDILQLVQDDKVLVYMPTKGLSEAKLYGEKEVKERLGVTPKQVVDYKALAGDASDNYPGVAGIGPKTAQALLAKFGTVQKLYEALAAGSSAAKNIPEMQKERLVSDKENAFLSRMLAAIKTDVPLDVDFGTIALGDVNTPEARAELTKLGFMTLLRRVMGETGKPAKKEKKELKKKGESFASAQGKQQELF